MKKGEQTKQTILYAAMVLLGREGFEGFSAAALAQEAGVSKATLFHHFSALEEIPLLAFEHLCTQMLTRERPPLQLREYLAALGLEMLDMAREQRTFLNAYFAFFAQAMFNPALRDSLLRSVNILHTKMLDAFTEKLPISWSASEIEATTCLIEMALDGMGMHLLVLRDEDELARAWSRFIDLIAPTTD